MSKESYARGFCKAAAAAGVDPVALAKYAQWAPKNVAELGTDKIPSYHGSLGDSIPVSAESNPVGVSVANGFADDDTYSHLRSLVDPSFNKWWTAHTNALAQAAKPINEVLDSGINTSPTNENWLADHNLRSRRVESLGGVQDHEVMKYLAKIYHDSMKNSTGSVSRVSQSAKK